MSMAAIVIKMTVRQSSASLKACWSLWISCVHLS